MTNNPTLEQVTEFLEAGSLDKSRWIGMHGASDTPGHAEIRCQPPQPEYCPTYGFIKFAGQTMAWRIFSQRTATPAFLPAGAFRGADLANELRAACRAGDGGHLEILMGNEWRK